jgi:hypothetical protein
MIAPAQLKGIRGVLIGQRAYRSIDLSENAMVDSRRTMIRKFLILTFVVSVAANSLAAVTPHLDGEGGCAADCCRAARQNQPGAILSKLCCLAQCGQPGETQGSPSTSLLRSGRDERSPLLVGGRLEAEYSAQPWESAHLPARVVVQSTHIYLSTGTLLI